MVDVVDKLSDAELRTKLIEYGFPVMPITGTTRKLMVKKLKLLMDSKNKIGNDNRRSLGRYSSEEESDTDIKVVRKDKNRRATMAAPPAQPSLSRTRRSTRRHDSDDASESSRSSVTKDVVTTKRSTKTVKTVQDDFDTGSDSEPEIIENDYESPTRVTSTLDEKKESPVSPSLSSSFRFQSAYSPKSTSLSFSSLSNRPVSTPRLFSFSSTTADNDGALDRLNQIRSRLSLGNQGYERPTFPATIDNAEEKVETPFLSNFTRRLSQLSANSPKQEYDFKNDVIKEHDTNGASHNRAYLGRARYRDINRDYYSRHDSNIFKNNMVSFGVLAVAILFFLVVGAMYYGMRNGESALDVSGNIIPRCTVSDPNARPGLNCIHDDDLEGAISLMKTMKPELARRAVAFACSDPGTPKPYILESEVVARDQKWSKSLKSGVKQDLESLEVLIFRNPDWGISVLQTDDGGDVAEENVLKSMEQVKHYRASKSIALAILHPDVPWRCTFYSKLYAIFNTVLFLSVTFLALYCGNFGFKYYKQYQQRKKDEVFQMVEKIVDVLQANSAGEEDNGFLVINHVRDMILPISDRKKMEATWLEAIRFINENESRIRVEVQTIQGEPYEVWRWLGSPNLNMSGSPRSKTWQGQAFETQLGAVNSLPCSPTPCLKIRGMVDDNEHNLSAIKEAVLSKCAHLCRILHCAVDSTSKCVYIKCADQSDAAVAYRNLHGWWYAGHLVTVKYLRLERYMQRFADSPVSGPPYLKSISPPTDWSS